MHFAAGSHREKDDNDNCRKVLGVTSGCSSGEPTGGCPQIDENKARSQPGEIFSGQTVLGVAVSVEWGNS